MTNIEFADRPHLMMAADGWDQIAQKIEVWITGVLSESAIETRTTLM